jgi:hypothetical protein
MQTGEPRPSFLSLIHPSAWNWHSQKFVNDSALEN